MPAFVSKAIASFGLRFGGLGLQFLGAILLARVLGVAQYGAYAYVFAWVIICGTILGLGLGPLAVREVPRFVAKGRKAELRGYMLVTLAAIAVTGALTSGIFAFLQARGLLVLESGWALAAIMAVIQAMILFFSSVMAGFQRVVTSQLYETFLRQGTYLAIIAGMWALGVALTPWHIFILWCVTGAGVLAVMAFYLRRDMAAMKPEAGLVAPARGIRLEPRLWFVAALPLLGVTMTNNLQTDIDTLMVGLLLDDTHVGIYRAASRGAALATVANFIGIQILGPMLSRALAQGNDEEAQRLLSLCALVSAGLGLGVCAVMGFGAHYYLWFFGNDFVAGSGALQILVLGQAIGILSGAVATVLIMVGRERVVLWCNVSVLLLNVVLNWLFIQWLGVTGAAWATTISVVVMKLYLLGAVLRHTRFNPTLFRKAIWQKGGLRG